MVQNQGSCRTHPTYTKRHLAIPESVRVPSHCLITYLEITALQSIGALEPTPSAARLETVKWLTQLINKGMDYALNTGLVTFNPAARIGRPFHKLTIKHHPALAPEKLPLLMQKLAFASIGRQTRGVIKWQLLTMTRPAEAAMTHWDEINFTTKEGTSQLGA